MFYEVLSDGKVRCNLCRHRCVICKGKRGICRVRENKDGKLYTLVYGKPIAIHVDPIEKKPLFHFLPGTTAFSIATVGCNFHCNFCQNWDISQDRGIIESSIMEKRVVTPETLVEYAKRYGSDTIAYTYTEPTIFYEYAYETAKLATETGILNIFVTNGYITEEALREIKPYLHGANIDLKGWSDSYYRKIVGALLNEVLDSIKTYKKLGIWLELTTLIVPGHNDREEDLREIARFIKTEVGEDTPWHISRFYPHYKMRDLPPTPIETLKRAYEIGKEEGLNYIYLGNVPGMGENTYCHNCGKLLIKRWGYEILEYNLTEDGRCPECGAKIPGIFKNPLKG